MTCFSCLFQSPSLSGTDSDEGPASKYPRLSQSVGLATPHTSGSDAASEDDVDDAVMDTGVATLDYDDDVDMVGAMASVRGGVKRRGGVSREEIRSLEERVASPRLLDGGGAGKTPDGESGVMSTTRRSGSNFNK